MISLAVELVLSDPKTQKCLALLRNRAAGCLCLAGPGLQAKDSKIFSSSLGRDLGYPSCGKLGSGFAAKQAGLSPGLTCYWFRNLESPHGAAAAAAVTRVLESPEVCFESIMDVSPWIRGMLS